MYGITYHLHVWHKMILLIGINEEGSDSKAQEDESSCESDHADRDLLSYQGAADDWKDG